MAQELHCDSGGDHGDLIRSLDLKKVMKERDAMICRACGNQERASEGYPCERCGTFICIICTFRGISLCTKCAAEQPANSAAAGATSPRLDWPEH